MQPESAKECLMLEYRDVDKRHMLHAYVSCLHHDIPTSDILLHSLVACACTTKALTTLVVDGQRAARLHVQQWKYKSIPRFGTCVS